MRFLFALGAGLGAALAAVPAMAGTQVFTTAQGEFLPGTPNQGAWNTALPVQDASTLTRAGFWYIPQPTNPLTTPGLGEIRSFFTFDLRGLDLRGALPSTVVLRMPHGTVSSAAGVETLGFHQVTFDPREVNTQGRLPPADLFADLGDGPLYATYAFRRTVPATQLVEIRLTGAALQDVFDAAGGYFTVGMAMQPSSYSGDPRVGGVPIPPAGPGAFLEVGADYRAGSGPGFVPAELLVTAVPEPATWAMMIAGFGLVGAAMRRRASPLAG